MTEMQKRILSIFKDVLKVIEQLNLNYFAIGGTCLGAVRHKGFIPWDDDLDIAMPIDDLLNFINNASSLLPKYLEIKYPCNTTHLVSLYVKVVDNRTTAIESCYAYWKDAYSGVWIDIFPLPGLPDNVKNRNAFISKFAKLCTYMRKQRLSIRSQKSILGKMYWLVYAPIKLIRNNNYYWDIWDKMMTEYPYTTSKYTGIFCSEGRSFVVNKEYFLDYCYLDFEDIKIKCPKNFHEFLSDIYGNYMQFPPEEKRNSGHDFKDGIIDVNHSYYDYQNGKYMISKH